MQVLLGKTVLEVGYFRLKFIEALKKKDCNNHIKTILTHFEVDLKPKLMAFAYNGEVEV